MSGLLGTVGFGFLVCCPCLSLIAGVSLAAFGGAMVTFALNPLVQATGVLLASGAVEAAGWYARQRRACPQCEIERTQGTPPETVRHEMHP